MTIVSAHAIQAGAWGRQDNGSETTASFQGAQNSNWNQPVDIAFRLRILITGTSTNTMTPQLQCSRNGGAYFPVTAASTFCKSHASAFVTDGTATTSQMTGNTGFSAGVVTTADAICPAVGVGACQSTEEEFGLILSSADGVVAGDTFDFEVFDNLGSASVVYTVVNRATATSSRVPDLFPIVMMSPDAA